MTTDEVTILIVEDDPPIRRLLRATLGAHDYRTLEASTGAEALSALDAGADDYITKPFGADELMARLRAALRHRLEEQGAERGFTSGDLSIDLASGRTYQQSDRRGHDRRDARQVAIDGDQAQAGQR